MTGNHGAGTSQGQNDRKALHAYMSDEAHETWHDYAARMGVSVSGLLEALADQGALDSFTEASEVVQDARRVDTDRRRRRPT